MTGYGNLSEDFPNFSLKAEVKSLNSKFLDLTIRLPRQFADREPEVRTLISKLLDRGKVTVSVELNSQEGNLGTSYNKEMFQKHYHQLNELASTVGAPIDDLFRLALNSPDVISANKEVTEVEECWKKLRLILEGATDNCDQFRIDEGQKLKVKLIEYISAIRALLDKIIEQEPIRIKNLKNRIEKGLVEFVQRDTIDENRYEQELIYYIEKLDIHEEKVRLESHLDYFMEIIESDGNQGKKLGFISQEIGREINTIGSKANDAVIQKHVIDMKEELEKIKEQLLNIV